jgi:hypothetical protein
MGLPCRGNPRGTRLRVGPDRAKHDDIRRFRAAGQGQALPLPLYSYENRSKFWLVVKNGASENCSLKAASIAPPF